ncbi:MAG: class II aldolase/adducin family protein [Desulfovibrionaceae bacterium]
MERLVEKYAAKLRRAGACEAPLVAGQDDAVVWNGGADQALAARFSPVVEGLGAAGFVLGRPAGPLGPIVDFLAAEYPGGLTPRDTETRTFLHFLPVAEDASPGAVARALAGRRGALVPGLGFAARGAMTPEQAFVTYSSLCFACFVLFFSDHLRLAREGGLTPARREAFARAVALLPPFIGQAAPRPELARGPLETETRALAAMAEAGRAVVDLGLVDSFFGNVSALVGGTVLISQTGSSLDELEGCVDPCPLPGGGRASTASLTASSELSAHLGAYAGEGGGPPRWRTILHGHPRFTVVMSMDCPDSGGDPCEAGRQGRCHVACERARELPGGAPIVPGEVGTGPTGLWRTLPLALARGGAAAVWGHGFFAAGEADFRAPLTAMIETENACRKRYFELLAGL